MLNYKASDNETDNLHPYKFQRVTLYRSGNKECNNIIFHYLV